MLSEEQTEQIKKQVIGKIESTFPEDRKDKAIKQIETMNSDQFENFLKQNKLIHQNPESTEGQCIFCLINSGQIPSYKFDESKNAIAVLEINPVSKAHSLIIPKNHGDEKITKNIYAFAEKLSKKIKTKFKPKEIILSENNLFGHRIINLIPVYENETINSNRYQAEKEELENVKKILVKKSIAKKKTVKKTKKPKGKKSPAKKKPKENQWLPRRIP
ncbi:MAG: HIT domain-containing protein [Nanoarchaeota archaeon]|nr:HIT domain-containing protein [Nanoarchaeota archaeon]